MKSLILTGTVIKAEFGKGSKSEHNALYISTDKAKYRLKRRGGNPFYDEILHKLIGKTIQVEGNLTDHFFEITSIPVLIKSHPKNNLK